jgi:excisionase family DNA binding protein
MSAPRERLAPPLYTVSDLARFCQVDTKTILNWAAKNRIAHVRTPGRHLRFRRLDVIDFLREHGWGVPDALARVRPTVLALTGNRQVLASVRRALGWRADIESYAGWLDALLDLKQMAPDALLVDLDGLGHECRHCAIRLCTLPPELGVRVVGLSDDEALRNAAMEAGAVAALAPTPHQALRETLDALLGLPSAPSTER